MTLQKENSKKTRIVSIVAGLISFVVAYLGIQYFLSRPDFEAQMKEAASELNEQLPMIIDEFTRLDSATVVSKSRFAYHYTLKNVAKPEVNLDTVAKYIKPGIIENIKNSPELAPYRENKITMDYVYYDKDGYLVTTISVTPDLYTTE
ncbi:hypothetical protein [Ascidiimonas aurantiaca]|uniref:hypothetical protein n=1 Tax=Ascidiimonas aurantiaca TaxID=1685432 RepID=UPI0030ECC270